MSIQFFRFFIIKNTKMIYNYNYNDYNYNMGNCGWKVNVKKVQNGVVIENPISRLANNALFQFFFFYSNN